MMKLLAGTLHLIAAMAAAGSAAAAEFPERPLRIINPQSVSALTDDTGRFLSQAIGKQFNQAVIVENRSGAGGLIGTQWVLRTQPFGYHFLLSQPAMVTNLFAYRNPGYAREDLAVMGVLGLSEYAMTLHTSIPANTVQELVRYAKANPDKLNYSSVGPASGNTLLTERFKQAAGINMQMIPFKGGGEALAAMLAGSVHFNLANIGTAKLRLQNQQLKGIAVTGEKRSRLLPDLPTFKEAGFPTMSGAAYWNALLIPSKTPLPIMRRLREAMGKVTESPEFKARLEKLELEGWSGTAEEFDAYLDHYARLMAEDFKRMNVPLMD